MFGGFFLVWYEVAKCPLDGSNNVYCVDNVNSRLLLRLLRVWMLSTPQGQPAFQFIGENRIQIVSGVCVCVCLVCDMFFSLCFLLGVWCSKGRQRVVCGKTADIVFV